MELTAAKATSGSPKTIPLASVDTVKISRRNMKLYVQFNNNAEQEAYDFSGFTSFFDTPLTIGSSTQADGSIFRGFKGTLSNIVIKLEQ